LFHHRAADYAWLSLRVSIDAAITLGDIDRADKLVRRVDQLDGTDCPAQLRGLAGQAHGRIAARRGQHDLAEASFVAALQSLRSIEAPFDLAVTLVEYGEWLAGQGRRDDAEPTLMEARGIFESLLAAPWLHRVDRALSGDLAVGRASGFPARA
jgi:tetratricopeptide (TPR) repeat protein